MGCIIGRRFLSYGIEIGEHALSPVFDTILDG
jgi:hypothetical protein